MFSRGIVCPAKHPCLYLKPNQTLTELSMPSTSKPDTNDFKPENRASSLAMALEVLARSFDAQASKRYMEAAQAFAVDYEEQVEGEYSQLADLIASIRRLDPTQASYLCRKMKPAMSMDAFKGFVLITAQTLRNEKSVQTPFEESWLVFQMFENSRFHESLLSNHFRETEGSACSADKARTVTRALLSGAIYGKYPEFNYEGEYTFHLPKLSLKTPEELKKWGNLACRAANGDIMPLALFKQSFGKSENQKS